MKLHCQLMGAIRRSKYHTGDNYFSSHILPQICMLVMSSGI